MRTIVIASLLALVAGRVDWGPVTLRIEASRPEYHVGDSIRVRLTLVNQSARPATLVGSAAYNLAPLGVYDENGTAVPRGYALGGRSTENRAWSLGGKQKLTLRDSDYFCAPDKNRPNYCRLQGRNFSEWMLLDNWGYHLTTPGRYTIVGVHYPPPKRLPGPSGRSNAVVITILP